MESQFGIEAVDYFDTYGFAVFAVGTSDDPTQTVNGFDERCHQFSESVSEIGSDKEWAKVFKRWTHYKNGLGVKLLSLLKKGVPNHVRPRLWKKLLDIDLLKNSTQFCYQEQVARLREHMIALNFTEYNMDRAEQQLGHVENHELQNGRLDLCGEPSVQNLRQICLDVARTFPTHLLYMGDSAEAIEGRASLFRILAIYARFNPIVGYCQGMSFIAGMLAMVLSEEDSFWCMVALLQKKKYLQGYFDATLSRVQMHAKIFDRLLLQRQSQLWEYLRGHKVDPLMYITPWLMCLFTSLPCWDAVLGCWDLILLDGFTVIFRVALAIMEVIKDTFMSETDSNILIQILQRPPATRLSRDLLLPIVWKTSVDLWELQTIQAVIDEELMGGDSMCISKEPAWHKVKKKIKNDQPSLLSKIVQIFNAKSPKKKCPVIMTTTNSFADQYNCPLQDVNGRRSPDVQIIVSGMSNATSENLNRVYRLVSHKRPQSQSVESLGKLVDYVADGGASQMQALSVFSHQMPLRQDQRSRTSLNVTGLSPELELQSVSTIDVNSKNKMTPIKKRMRTSTGYATSPGNSEDHDVDVHCTNSPKVMPRFRKNANKQPQKQRDLRAKKRLHQNDKMSVTDIST